MAEELLHLPASASVEFVTGAQGGTVGLAAGRWQVLNRAGWDVGRDGLFGAPRIRVVVGAGVTPSTAASASSASAGPRSRRCLRADGSMDTTELPRARIGDSPTIVCAQAGNVNTGACDDLVAAAAARAVNAWLHVDGAFGLWAAASPRTRHLVEEPSSPTRGRVTGTSG